MQYEGGKLTVKKTSLRYKALKADARELIEYFVKQTGRHWNATLTKLLRRLHNRSISFLHTLIIHSNNISVYCCHSAISISFMWEGQNIAKNVVVVVIAFVVVWKRKKPKWWHKFALA